MEFWFICIYSWFSLRAFICIRSRSISVTGIFEPIRRSRTCVCTLDGASIISHPQVTWTQSSRLYFGMKLVLGLTFVRIADICCYKGGYPCIFRIIQFLLWSNIGQPFVHGTASAARVSCDKWYLRRCPMPTDGCAS